MRIAIDARPLASRLTGIGTYLVNLLLQIQAIDNQNEYFLYSHKDFDFPLLNQHWHKRIGRGLLACSGTLYFSTVLPRELSKDKVDLFWGTVNILPPGLRVKKALTVHDLASYLFPGTLSAYNLFINRLLLKRSISLADRIIAVSMSTGRDISKLFGVDPGRISVVYNGVDDQFKPQNKADSAKYIAKKYITQPRYIVFVGTVEPRKNLAKLIMAFRMFLDEYKMKCQLLVVGGAGWKNSTLFRTYSELRFSEEEVKFLGFVPQEDLPRIYSGAMGFVYPSLYEGFGFPPLEAMACGCPVVVSDASSMPEVCGDAAIYIDPSSVDSIAAGINTMLTDKTKREDRIDKGFTQAAKFNWKRSAMETISVLEGVYAKKQ